MSKADKYSVSMPVNDILDAKKIVVAKLSQLYGTNENQIEITGATKFGDTWGVTATAKVNSFTYKFYFSINANTGNVLAFNKI